MIASDAFTPGRLKPSVLWNRVAAPGSAPPATTAIAGSRTWRTLIFMNRHDMRDRDIKEFDGVDIVATARDGSTRSLHRY
jgi:hypothetical protein